jgi:RimJ/RimL family protein N-acetyltransferase
MLKRTLEAAFLNAVANHPEVRPWIGGEGELDLSAIAGNPINVALIHPHGGWVFVRHEPGTYEVHTLCRAAGRGKGQLTAWREAARWMFTRTDAREIVTRIPDDNPGAGAAAALCGFRQRFRREKAFRSIVAGRLVDVSYQALTIDDWAGRDPTCLDAGMAFHDRLEAAKARAASALPDHPGDLAHDRAAGAACLMIAATNVRKGVWFYNRWAALAGYPPIAILSLEPVVIDLGAGVIAGVTHETMEILSCP